MLDDSAGLTAAKRPLRLPDYLPADILDLMTTPQEAEDFHTLYIVTELFEADLTRILSSKQVRRQEVGCAGERDDHAIVIRVSMNHGITTVPPFA